MPEPERNGNGGAGGRTPGRCVVVLPRPSAGAEALLSGLRGRGAAVRVVPHPAAALVELAGQAGGALVVVDPGVVGNLPELLAALRRYYPQVACWQYDSSGWEQPGRAPLTRLAAPVTPPESPAPPEPAAPPGRKAAPAARRAVAELLDGEAAAGPAQVAGPLLTQEEVAMLIGRPFEDDLVVDDAKDEDEP